MSGAHPGMFPPPRSFPQYACVEPQPRGLVRFMGNEADSRFKIYILSQMLGFLVVCAGYRSSAEYPESFPENT